MKKPKGASAYLTPWDPVDNGKNTNMKYGAAEISNTYRLVSAPDIHFFYTSSHLSALQNCALLFSTNFQFILIFKNDLHNLVIELCRVLFIFQNTFTCI